MSLPVVNQPTHRTAALLDYLARRMRLRAESALAPLGLRSRHLVALTVLREGGESTQQALSTTLQIDRTNLVGLLNELEADQLIERRRSSEDRRRHIVELTAAGANVLAKVEAALTAVEDEVLGGLDAEQRETLYSLLQQATSDHAPQCPRAIDEY
jgi:MarR family transcriptional regulator, lower aerobic nicotinate degradation pathway regulator